MGIKLSKKSPPTTGTVSISADEMSMVGGSVISTGDGDLISHPSFTTGGNYAMITFDAKDRRLQNFVARWDAPLLGCLRPEVIFSATISMMEVTSLMEIIIIMKLSVEVYIIFVYFARNISSFDPYQVLEP